MEQLGDYTILKQLGHGPFGEVYLAEHRFIKTLFAIKVLPEDVGVDPTFFRRFESEVKAIAAIDHPHIVKIHNVSCAEGRYFLVTDPIIDSFQETMHLERFLQLKGRSLSEEDIEELLRQIGSALDYAHEKGIVHGGLKPSNILVSATSEGIRLLLTDFAIHRLIGEGVGFIRLCSEMSKALILDLKKPSEKALQLSRSFLRNFSFLAPEQKTVEPIASDAKADTYAFGILAYYLLTLRTPEGYFDLPSQLVADPKNHWDQLIIHCMQTHPKDRPLRLIEAMDSDLKIEAPVERLADIAPKIESIQQMAFDFPQKIAPVFAAAAIPLEEASLKPILKPQEIIRPEYGSDPMAIFQKDLGVSSYTPKKIEVEEIEPILTEMMIVPADTYWRGGVDGARDETPRHSVILASFALDIHPVTNEQFIRFLQAMGGEKDQNNNDIIRLRDARIKRSAGKLIVESGYAKHPVVGVTWYGSTAYAKWVGKRLPTEAEWEAAATCGKENFIFPTGLDIERTQANFFSSDTTAVMSYPSNPLGIYDMAGNVYEWCQDWYAYNYYDTSSLESYHPAGPQQGVYRVLRGGCWKSLKEDLRCSHRHRNNPGAVNGTYGFRCAADVSI